MELSFHESTLHYLQETVCDTVYQEETTEVIVPDSMPDIERIVDCFGQIILRSKETAGGVSVSGGIQAGVLYVPEGGEGLCRMEAYLPFTVKRNAADMDAASDATWQGWLRAMDARMLNSRKVLVRANLGSRICVYTPAEEQLAQPEELPDTVQVMQNTYPMLLNVCCGEKDLQLDEELILPETLPAIEKLWRVNLHTEITESKMVGSKAVFKGEAHLRVLYGDADGGLHSYHGQVPFSQYAQMPCEADDGEADVRIAVTESEIDTDGQPDSHRLLLRLHLLAQVCVSARLPVTLTEDAYALRGSFTPKWQNCCLRAQLDSEQTEQNGELTVPAKATRIVDTQMFLDIPSVRADRDMLWVTSAANVCVLYYDDTNQLQGKSARGEVSCTTQLADGGSCCAQVQPAGDVRCTANADEITVQCPVSFRLKTYSGCQWQNLCGAELTESAQEEKRPSVVVCRAGNDSLWALAKKNRTTINSIREANSLGADGAQEGSVLLIPLRS